MCCGGEDEPDSGSNRPIRKNVCCTDIFFLILFVVFWAGMIYIAVFSIIQGDALRLVFGYDSFGNTCNKRNTRIIANISHRGQDTRQKPNVFFMDILSPFDCMQVCVQKCPDRTLLLPGDVKKFAEETGSRLCRYDIGVEDYDDLRLYTKNGPCPVLPVVKSLSMLNRCVPDVTTYIGGDARNMTSGIIRYLNADDIARKLLSDFYSSWKELIALCFIALVIGLLMVVLIRYLAVVIVWLILALSILGSIAGTGFLWWVYVDTKRDLDKRDKEFHIPLLDVDINQEQTFLVFAIIATVLTVILLLIILVMRKHIMLVVALFKEAGKCMIAVPTLLIQPVWTFLILMGFFVYWGIIFGFIHTAGKPEVDYDHGFERVTYTKMTQVRYFWWYHLVGLIWTSEFILACQQMVISGAVAKWYFTRNKAELGCVVGKSVCSLILHHLGSVAFGSLIITLVKLPRMILMYIQAKCKDSENMIAKCCLKCCICCLWCLEKCLKFLNQNAYTIIAIEGKSFCPACAKAFSIIASNILRVAAVNSVGNFVLFLGKIGVMACTGTIAIVWLKEKENLHYFAVPVLLICVFSYFIAYCFLSIYDMVIDTLLLCFCEDCQMNDGTDERKYYMDPSLMTFVSDSCGKLGKYRRPQEAEMSEKTELNANN